MLPEAPSYPLLSRRAFAVRMLSSGLAAFALVALSLAAGAVGYRVTVGCGWLDAFHAAAMILTGMGPVVEVTTDSGKLFETACALFSGIAFLSAATITLAPLAHRLMHYFHLEGRRRS